MAKRSRRILLAPFVTALMGALALVLVASRSAEAVPTVLTSGDMLGTTGWKVEFVAPVQLSFDPARTDRGTAGTLIEETIRTDFAFTTITFTQVNAAPTSDVSEGLRLLVMDTPTNDTPAPWTGYEFELLDDSPSPNVPPSGLHPPQPHFHPPYVVTGLGIAPGGDPNPGTFISLAGGPVPNGGGQFTIDSILLHEREFAGSLRSFRLLEAPVPGTPVPEPITMFLGGTGLVLLGYAARRRLFGR